MLITLAFQLINFLQDTHAFAAPPNQGQGSQAPATLLQPMVSNLDSPAAYPSDNQPLPLVGFQDSGALLAQRLVDGMHQRDGAMHLPNMPSSSSSEPGSATLLAQQALRQTAGLQDNPFLRRGAGSVSGSQELRALGVGSGSSSLPMIEENVIKTLQQMSIIGQNKVEHGRVCAALQLPQMPAAVWQGMPSPLSQVHHLTWEDLRAPPSQLDHP